MWISRKLLTELLDAHKTAADMTGAATQARAEVEKKQQTIDWLMTYVNDLRTERAILLDRVLGLKVPVAEFVRANPVPAASPVNTATTWPEDMPEDARQALQTFLSNRQFRAVDDTPVENPLDALGQLGAAIFEDMGDEEARKQGVKHDETGEVRYGG